MAKVRSFDTQTYLQVYVYVTLCHGSLQVSHYFFNSTNLIFFSSKLISSCLCSYPSPAAATNGSPRVQNPSVSISVLEMQEPFISPAVGMDLIDSIVRIVPENPVDAIVIPDGRRPDSVAVLGSTMFSLIWEAFRKSRIDNVPMHKVVGRDWHKFTCRMVIELAASYYCLWSEAVLCLSLTINASICLM